MVNYSYYRYYHPHILKYYLYLTGKNNYHDYFTALKLTHLQTLKERRKCLSLTFAKKCLKSEKSADMFPRNMKNENLRPKERYFVTPAKTERLARSTIPYLQRLLNEEC